MQVKTISGLSLADTTVTFLLVIFSICFLLLPIDVFGEDTVSHRIEPGMPNSIGSKNALVIYFSRTGNTEAVAMEIANRYQADLKNIKADDYSDDFTGAIRANVDAWNKERISVISPVTIDMTRYKVIFLGSPIWWYRPAVPLWTFVEKNNFQGKSVVLFNTFNSRFKAEYIEEFQALVEEKGGDFIDHIYVRRGRIVSQIDRNELIKQFRKLLKNRESKWIEVIR
jgi:flavodoxin